MNSLFFRFASLWFVVYYLRLTTSIVSVNTNNGLMKPTKPLKPIRPLQPFERIELITHRADKHQHWRRIFPQNDKTTI